MIDRRMSSIAGSLTLWIPQLPIFDLITRTQEVTVQPISTARAKAKAVNSTL